MRQAEAGQRQAVVLPFCCPAQMRKSLAKPRRRNCDLVRPEAAGIYFARGKRNTAQQNHSGSVFHTQIEVAEIKIAGEQLLQSRPATLGQRHSRRLAAVDLQTQPFAREISDRATAHVHDNGFEIQTDGCSCRTYFDVKSRVTCADHVKSVQHHRPQERRLYLVDLDRETLLPRFPPNPQAEAI